MAVGHKRDDLGEAIHGILFCRLQHRFSKALPSLEWNAARLTGLNALKSPSDPVERVWASFAQRGQEFRCSTARVVTHEAFMRPTNHRSSVLLAHESAEGLF